MKKTVQLDFKSFGLTFRSLHERAWGCSKFGTFNLFLFVAISSFPYSAIAQTDDKADVVYETDDIVVTGSRTEHKLTDAPVATELISKKDIENSGSKNAAEILETHPGIQISRSFRGASIRLQGLDPKHVLILVDGQLLNGRIDGAIDLSRFAAEDIDHIEIVKGPSSALYGSNAMGGVVNIITRRSDSEYEAMAELSYGSLNAINSSGSAGLKTEKLNTLFSAGWHQREAFDLDTTNLATSGSSFSKFNVANKTRYEFNKNWSLAGRVDYQQGDNNGIDESATRAIFDRRNLTEIFSASLTPVVKLEDGSQFKFSSNYQLFRDQFKLDQRNSNALDSYQEQRESLVQNALQYDRLVFERHLVTVGAEAVFENLDSERIENGSTNNLRGALFLQNEWNVFDDPLLVLVPGVRLDLDSNYGFHPTPKIGFRFDPHETITFRGSYGMGFRAPAFKELFLFFENPSAGYVVVGNPDLKPETSQSGNLGFEFNPRDDLWISANLFHNEITDLIFAQTTPTLISGTPQFTYENINNAFTQGLDLNAQLKISKYFRATTGTSFMITGNRTLKRPLEGRPELQATIGLQFENKDWGFNAQTRGSFVGSRPFYNGVNIETVSESRRADPYANLNLRVAQKVGSHIQIFAGIDNILNAGDIDFLAIQPRSFYGGIRGQLGK